MQGTDENRVNLGNQMTPERKTIEKILKEIERILEKETNMTLEEAKIISKLSLSVSNLNMRTPF